MNLRQLQYFVEVSELESVTKAAERLHVAQPALTRHMRTLERDLGVRLFARNGRGITLTNAGVVFRDRVRDVLRELDRAQMEVKALSRSPGGRIDFGMPFSISQALTRILVQRVHARAAGRFAARHRRLDRLHHRMAAARPARSRRDLRLHAQERRAAHRAVGGGRALSGLRARRSAWRGASGFRSPRWPICRWRCRAGSTGCASPSSRSCRRSAACRTSTPSSNRSSASSSSRRRAASTRSCRAARCEEELAAGRIKIAPHRRSADPADALHCVVERAAVHPADEGGAQHCQARDRQCHRKGQLGHQVSGNAVTECHAHLNPEHAFAVGASPR